MGSDRLEDLVVISSEKSTPAALKMSSVVSRFALTKRGLPLQAVHWKATVIVFFVFSFNAMTDMEIENCC